MPAETIELEKTDFEIFYKISLFYLVFLIPMILQNLWKSTKRRSFACCSSVFRKQYQTTLWRIRCVNGDTYAKFHITVTGVHAMAIWPAFSLCKTEEEYERYLKFG